MRLEFHKQVTADISRIMDYYEDAAGPQLADEFYSELRSFFQKAAETPEAYGIRENESKHEKNAGAAHPADPNSVFQILFTTVSLSRKRS